MNKKITTKSIALTGILSSQALSLSYLESLIPAIPGFPPGAKPGFSNIIVMFAAQELSPWQAFAITLIKALFAGLTRGITAFFMSLAGGLLSTAAALIIFKKTKIKFGYIGTAIICAACHNLGQLCIACLLSGTFRLFIGYGPFLLLASALTGFLTGTVLKYVMPALQKQMKFIIHKGLNK